MKKMIIPVVAFALLFTTSCKMDKTQKGEMPDVDVSVDEGQLPEYDVDWAEVNVGTKTEMVEIPNVVVVMEETEVEIPYLDVDMPSEYGEKEERTIRVEAEVDNVEHKLEIDKVYASGNNLIVLSNLEKGDKLLGDKKMRVSDQIKINAPDLNVRHYIVGEKPNRLFNDSYKYISNKNELDLDSYRVIYSD